MNLFETQCLGSSDPKMDFTITFVRAVLIYPLSFLTCIFSSQWKKKKINVSWIKKRPGEIMNQFSILLGRKNGRIEKNSTGQEMVSKDQNSGK